MTTKTAEVAPKNEKNITDLVTTRIQQLTATGELKIPSDYSAENAMKSAYLHLVEMKNKDNKPVLESCSRESIANSLMRMVVQGLNVSKNQCYFIPYGDQLNFQRSYQGSIALAKRVGGVKQVNAVVIYDKDEFDFEIDVMTGTKKITKHVQKFENIDNGQIKGAYAVRINNDGSVSTEIMTIAEIEQAWQQGATKGNSPAHKNFRQEMAKKTVISRACKEPIATSSDYHLLMDEDFIKDTTKSAVATEIEQQANSEAFAPFEEIKAPEPVKANEHEPTPASNEMAFPETK